MSASTEAASRQEPNHGFDDSRRLTGPNRWFGSSAVTITPLGAVARDAAAQADWAAHVQAVAAALGWPSPQPLVHVAPAEVTLAFAAPADVLFTATEINEWAWEGAAATHGARGFDIAQDLATADDAAVAAVFAARAAQERDTALAALRVEAAARGLLLLADDDSVSIGAGTGSSSTWPLSALPCVADVDWPALHGVPTALVTGSNGKTTTVRLLAAMAQHAGLAAGCCSTEGVVVGGQTLSGGDYAGPAGARAVLRDTRVQLAVLETARGGILRRGLAVDRADVAVVTNISPDHLGEYGVENADDLAEVKLVVARAVCGAHDGGAGVGFEHADGGHRQRAGVLVLNADDAVLMAAAARLPHVRACTWALFAMDHAHPALVARRAAGGSTCGVDARGHLTLTNQGQTHQMHQTRQTRQTPPTTQTHQTPPTPQTHDLGAIAQLPLTLGGAARHNVQNAACAALAAAMLGLPVPAIVSTLATFGSQPQHNPGRLERWPYRGATVLVDYAHNPDGLAQLLTVARALLQQDFAAAGTGRLGLLLGQAGNRDDTAIAQLAHTAAGFVPDTVVVKELPSMLRGRALGAVPALLRSALLEGGVAPERITTELDEFSAARQLLGWARPGDVVVLPIHTVAVRGQLAGLLTV